MSGLYDIRCKDIARFLATGTRTLQQIGDYINKLYSTIDPRGTWVREPLTSWNPYVKEISKDKYALSDLGRALVSLPGREREPPTEAEKSFLLGTMMLFEPQQKIVAELIHLGKSEGDEWMVVQSKRCLQKLGIHIP